jgi:hypothetical protein
MTNEAADKINERNGMLDEGLGRALADRLSAEEKLIRDRELVEQAHRYFGGLNDQERELLGLERVADQSAEEHIPELILESDEGKVRPADGRNTAYTREWAWAVASVMAFAVVLLWVIRGN